MNIMNAHLHFPIILKNTPKPRSSNTNLTHFFLSETESSIQMNKNQDKHINLPYPNLNLNPQFFAIFKQYTQITIIGRKIGAVMQENKGEAV